MGGGCRYLVSRFADSMLPLPPWAATLTVNVVGCFLIGVVYAFVASAQGGAPWWFRLLWAVGFCGGFTTFSTFINDAMGLLKASEMLGAGLYMCGSILLGFLALWGGYNIIR